MLFVSIVLAMATGDKQDGGSSQTWNQTELHQFVQSDSIPDWWDFDKHFITYGLIHDIFEALHELNKPQTEIVGYCNLLCNKNCLASVIKHAGSFKKKVYKYLAKPSNNPSSVFDLFYVRTENNDNDMGEYCAYYNINKDTIRGMMALSSTIKQENDGQFNVTTQQEKYLPQASSSNGIILELNEASLSLGTYWAEFRYWLCQLWAIDSAIDVSNLRTSVENLKTKKTKFVKRQKYS